MTDVTVVADDLTGAADCGIAFALAGLPTFVSIGSAPPPKSARIVSVDTDTRRLPEEEAARGAADAVSGAVRGTSRALYKKIDSTLRGHVAAELAAAFRAAVEASGEPFFVVFAPAFPGTGRVMRLGHVVVSGVRLEQTEVWRGAAMKGPAEPVAMLREAGLLAETVPLEIVRSGLPAAFESLVALGVQVAVCDAERDEDLRRIADAGAALRRRVIWVGSGGLARHLPGALGLRPPASGVPLPALRRGPILFVVGSRSTVAREQAGILGADGVATLELEPHALLEGPASPGWAASAARLQHELDAGRDALLITALGAAVDLRIAPALAAALGRFAAAAASRIGGLLATGGDIARAVLGALGAGGLQLLGEVEPGVPIGIANGAEPVPVVTKAGAFGTPQTLVRCRTALQRLIDAGSGAARSTGGGSS